MKKLVLLLFAAILITGCTPDINSINNSNIQTIDEIAKENDAIITSAQDVSATELTSTTPAITGKFKVHYIDVGQADCILIQTPGQKNMLIDAGNNTDSNTIITYLKSQGVSKIDVLVGTHPHEDHIGSMDSVINTFDIGSIYMPKASSNTKTFEDVLDAISVKGLKVITANAGVTIDLEPELKATILAPNNTAYEDLNNYSAVIKIIFGSTNFLFTGDAENISEKEIMGKGFDLKANVLKAGHHGSSYSTSNEFLSAVSPKYAIISVGKDNDYGHPTQDTLDRLTDAGVQVYRTDLSGTIVATSDGKSISFDKATSPIKAQAPPITKTIKDQTTSSISSSEEEYIGNMNTKKFHLPSCRSLPDPKNQVVFNSRDKAIDSGFVPCKICNP